jgi:hypothetical protein
MVRDLNTFSQELKQACDDMGVKINELTDLITDQDDLININCCSRLEGFRDCTVKKAPDWGLGRWEVKGVERRRWRLVRNWFAHLLWCLPEYAATV